MKKFIQKKSHTMINLADEGRQAFIGYKQLLLQVLTNLPDFPKRPESKNSEFFENSEFCYANLRVADFAVDHITVIIPIA